MRKWIIVSLAALALSVGCSNKKSSTASTVPPLHSAALDVPATPAAPAVTYTPPPQPAMHEPLAQQPVIEETTIDVSEETATYTTPARKASARVGGKKYTVRKGESLWSIAENRYGNGNKWKTIAAANPRLDPDRIQAGQTIVLP